MTREELIAYCESDGDVLHLLETDRAGEEVDNGMGVDFDLKPYAIITLSRDLKSTRKIRANIEDKEMASFFMDKVMVLTSHEDEDSVKDMLERLEADGYKIIWTNGNYKYPEEPVTEIVRSGTSVSFKVERLYKLKVSYQELKKYYESRKEPSTFGTDLFNYLLSRNAGHTAIVDKNRFLSDSAHLMDTRFTSEGVVFLFTCADGYNEEVMERDWESSPTNKEQVEKIQKRFEDPGFFDGITEFIKAKLDAEKCFVESLNP